MASRRRFAQLARHLLNLVAFTMLAQLIGAGMHKAGSTSEPVARQVTVGYSDFLRAAKTGRVSYVQLDGKHMTWLQREATVALPSPKAAARAGQDLSAAASAAEAPQTRYITTRPDDAVLPYDTLLASGAGFHAVSRAGQWSLMNVFNVVVRARAATRRSPRRHAQRLRGTPRRGDLRRRRAAPRAAPPLTRLAAGDGAVAAADGVGGDRALHAQHGPFQEPRRAAGQAQQARGAGSDFR